jgi:energy-coupling factor transporter ATP-binding protein EcfA2
MHTFYVQFRRSSYSTMLLVLGTILLGSCSRAQQLGVEDDPQEILNQKLNNPQEELTPNQSIALVNHCAMLGEQNAAPAANKEVLMVLGNTGTGKSTTLNYLMGCEMKLAKLSELGLKGVKKVVVVNPASIRPEVMSIGHGRRSHTFMPQIVPDPDNNNQAYCDCPGFTDNRGAEINIANAINTRRVLQQARGVKAVFLTSYNGLSDDRGASIGAMESMCQQMFGGIENLRRYQNAVLLGITKAPLYEYDEPLTRNMVQELLTQDNTPTAQILASRVFLFDPLDRGKDNPDFWSRERCLTEIDRLSIIPRQEATTLFQTVLTDGDRTHLLNTIRQLKPKIVNAITQGDVTALSQHWKLLQRLQVIEHPEIGKLIEGEIVAAINTAILQRVDAFKDDATVYNFDDAERALNLLTRIKNNLPGVTLSFDIDALKRHLEHCKKNKGDTKAMTKAVDDLRAEVERQKAEVEKQKAEVERQKELAKRRRNTGLQGVLTVVGGVLAGPVGAVVGNAVGGIVDDSLE